MRQFPALVFAALAAMALPALADPPASRQPLIDMHLHVVGVTPSGGFEWYDPVPPNPFTGKPTGKLTSSDALMAELFGELGRYRLVKAMVSSTPPNVARAAKAYPNLVIKGVFLGPEAPYNIPPKVLREDILAGRLQVLGELAPQYFGMPLTAPVFEQYYALAEEMDVPIGIHTGLASAPNEVVAAGLRTKYRGDYGNPAGLEEVLNRHPNLRLYLMHAGHPYFAETYGILQAYPTVYADLAYINYYLPREEFHRYLKLLIKAIPGVDKRLMFGTDAYLWKEAIKPSIEAIETADFLTAEQKADIFCNNAARFLRLDPATCKP